MRLRDILKAQGLTGKTIRGWPGRGSATPMRPRSNPVAVKKWSPPEARYTTPVVTYGYDAASHPRRISVIEEQAGEDEMPEVAEGADPLDDVDLTMLDEATIATIYEDLKDAPIGAPSQDEKDFQEGQ